MRRIANLIVILQEDDKLLGVESKTGSTAASLLPGVPLSLIEVTPFHRRNEFLGRALVIGVVVFCVPGHRHAGRMMKIVVPGGVEPKTALLDRSQQPRVLMLVFGDDERLPRAGRLAHATRDRRQYVVGRIVNNRMDGVDPQTIDVELVDPIAGIGDEELADRAAMLGVEVDRLAPIGAMPLGGVFTGELSEIIAGRTEVVVNHVENHADLEPMSLVDEPAEIVRRAIQPRGSEQIDAVIAPAEAAVEFGDRHDLDERDAQFSEAWQFGDGRCKRPLGRECADVQLINDLPLARRARPIPVVPLVAGWIDDHRHPVRPVRLESRRGIGVELRIIVQAKAVAVADVRLGRETGEIPVALLLKSDRRIRAVAGCSAASAEHNLNSLTPGRPDAEMDAAVRLTLRADRQTPGELGRLIMPTQRRIVHNRRTGHRAQSASELEQESTEATELNRSNPPLPLFPPV